ncbi:hypothetical protein SH528x_000169 [Novipirellula sp. SH528]
MTAPGSHRGGGMIEFSEDFVEADWCITGHIGYVVEGLSKSIIAAES